MLFTSLVYRLLILAGLAAGGAAIFASLDPHPAQTAVPAQAPEPLRVCADPNNLPFSNEREEGFENALARLIAEEMGRTVEYFWWPQRFGFVRNTLRMRVCDVIMGVPASYELAETTRPYYRSSYAFVSRRDRNLRIDSLDDERLPELRIGVHVVGDDYSNVPPVMALARRGITDNIVGYSVYGDYSQENPPAALIQGVIDGDIDAALAWGPLAGYFASRSGAELDVVPVADTGPSAMPFEFEISMGFRSEDRAFGRELDRILERRQSEIRDLLGRFGIPVIEKPPGSAMAGGPRGL